jgi:UDP-GlcNAc3NAcA epimerase
LQGRTQRIVSVVGARPQFIKAFPLSRAIAAETGLEEVMIHTGQHFDDNMSQIFFDELAIPPPRYRFDIHGGTHGDMTGRMLAAIEKVLLSEKPDAVLVYGDTNSTLAGALAAAKLHIPVAHVEAGLRSFNRQMPEELNRVTADHLSTLLFCPTPTAVANLAREGVTQGVHQVGDVMFDSTLLAVELAEKHATALKNLNLTPNSYAVATIHREENTDNAAMLKRLLDYLHARAKEQPIVMPLHPRTRKAIAAAGADTEGLTIVDPLGYLDMCQLVRGARFVLTDSGGLQKEAYFHRVPCVTLRSETEWVETVTHGWNRLWTADTYQPRRELSVYGDGNASRDIVRILQAALA